MKTTALRTQDIEQKWYLMDCSGKKLGRLSVQVANILRGKNKPEYTPNSDIGDFVVLVNAKKIEVTGNKAENKIYYRHTGYPGGIKETTPEKLFVKKPGEALKLAVKRMLPGGPLAKKQLTKLKIYTGSEHPHSTQNPITIDITKLNNKNIIRVR